MTTTDLMTGKQVPNRFADLAGLGVVTGPQPTSLNQSRIALVGYTGTGKSSVIHSNPEALVMDLEAGGRTVSHPVAARFPDWDRITEPPTFATYRDKVRQAIQMKKDGQLTSIKMIGVDTLDALFELWKRDTCREHKLENINDYKGGFGKGYDLGCEAIFGLLDEIHRAGLGWAVLVHVVDRTIKVGNADMTISSLAIPEKFQGHLGRIVEHMFFLDHAVETVQPVKRITIPGSTESVEVPDGPAVTRSIRRVLTTPGTALRGTRVNDAKVRVPMIPEVVLTPTNPWATLESEYNAAVGRMGS